MDIMALSKQDPCMHIQSTPDNSRQIEKSLSYREFELLGV